MSSKMRSRWPTRALCLVAAAQLGVSGAYITFFSQTFDFGLRLIATHLCLVSAGLAAGALMLGFSLRLGVPAVGRTGARLVPPVVLGALVVLYAADYVSNRSWGHNVTYDLTIRYLARPLLLWSYVRTTVPTSTIAAVLTLVLGGGVILASTRLVETGLRDLFMVEGTVRRGGRYGPAVALAGAALLAAAGAATLLSTATVDHRWHLMRREPLLGFWLDGYSAHGLRLSRAADEARRVGPIERAAYAYPANFDRRNVVLVIADSLRADHMSVYGYQRPTTPFLAQMHEAGRLRRVDVALATCPDSSCAIASILSSKTFGNLVPENFTLHALFRDLGYEVNFLLSGDHDWLGLREFYGQDVTRYSDGPTSPSYWPTDDRVVLAGLDEVPPFAGTPAFFFLHLMSAHQLGLKLPTYAVHEPAASLASWAGQRDRLVNGYDNGVRQADAIIEQVFQALDAKGYLKGALVVISSDHGDGLGDRAGFRGLGHGTLLYQDVLRIPLLIYDEPPAAYGNLSFASHVDIAPTILDRLGLPVPPSWEGRSLIDASVKPYSVHHDDGVDAPLYALVYPEGGKVYKYLREGSREEVFELTADPREQVNLLSVLDDVLLARLRRTLDARVDSGSATLSAHAPTGF
ncbi:MAG: sulfatase-like hydrolase/transferase [Acidobacteriota bacterium]